VATLLFVVTDGVIYASWLFIVAVGMTLVYGVMRVLNVAHGSLYALGAYTAATMVGAWFQRGYPPLGAFAVLLAAALIVGLVMGLILERGLLRFLYGRDEVVVVLATYATFLILEDVIQLIWGVEARPAPQPYSLLGTTSVGPLLMNNYDLSLVALALIVGGVTWWGLTRTASGKLLLAVIFDREMAEACGINVRRFFLVTFLIGSVLGALGGAYTAPMISVSRGLGVDVIVLAFAVVVVGGMGSIPGALLGAIMIGLSRAAAVHLLPQAEVFAIYLIMTLVLIVRPHGLLGREQLRKV
jgi:branched-chain amino acid transport system permease protein